MVTSVRSASIADFLGNGNSAQAPRNAGRVLAVLQNRDHRPRSFRVDQFAALGARENHEGFGDDRELLTMHLPPGEVARREKPGPKAEPLAEQLAPVVRTGATAGRPAHTCRAKPQPYAPADGADQRTLCAPARLESRGVGGTGAFLGSCRADDIFRRRSFLTPYGKSGQSARHSDEPAIIRSCGLARAGR